jgi:sugar lactone lactonase YvrE
LVNTIDPGLPPEVLDLAADGSIYCGGDGRVTKLSAGGRVLKTVEIPDEIEDDSAPSRGGRRPPGLSGLVVADDAIYVTFGSGWSVSSKAQLFRFDLDLENPVLVADGFRGCCQHCDLAFRDGVLYVAENAAFRIVSFDGLGELIGKWGSKSRGDLKLFGGCCNPMNINFGPDNVLYTAESGMGRVKRYTPQGEFLGLVGYLDTARFSRGSGFAAACCHIPIAVTPDGNRVYVADVKENIIRVLRRKP